jgi:hypothetical protein
VEVQISKALCNVASSGRQFGRTSVEDASSGGGCARQSIMAKDVMHAFLGKKAQVVQRARWDGCANSAAVAFAGINFFLSIHNAKR